MAKLINARVVKRDTEDGVHFLNVEVPIGFVYQADPDTITEAGWLDTRTGKTTKRTTITVYGSASGNANAVGPMPLELLALEELITQ
jgi:hypothetical protein